MTVNPLVQAIMAGEHDDVLDVIDRAVRSRKQSMFRPGTRVHVVGGGIDGQSGVVTKVNLKRVSVRLDSGREYLIPVSMLLIAD